LIARHWRGWTKRADADAYEDLLKNKVIPGLGGIDGYVGGSILRKDEATESEFAVINYFDSLDAVKQFAGANYLVPVFEPEAKALLIRMENYATHYEVRYTTE
jgi:antibiotic biosynthesis monooxygenase (ABM) superfamily enzyme